MSANGGDPCTYKKVQDDNYSNQLKTNLSLSNDGSKSTTNTYNDNTQQTNPSTSLNNSSSSTTTASETDNRQSSEHGKTS